MKTSLNSVKARRRVTPSQARWAGVETEREAPSGMMLQSEQRV